MTCSIWVIVKAQLLRNSLTKKPKKGQSQKQLTYH